MQRGAPPQKFARPVLRPGARAGTAFTANLAAAVAQIQANTPGVAGGCDAEYLHQLRVGIRRLRSTLRVFRSLLKRKQAARFDRRLREALSGMGAARDWDVFEAAFGSPALQRHARRHAQAARRRARATARSPQFRYLSDEVLAWARGGPWRESAQPREALLDFAQRALEQKRERLIESAEGIDWRDAARRHRVRIRVKRLRYGCECFAAAWNEEQVQPLLGRLRRLQEILGELNDIDVQRQLLQDLAHTAAPAAQVGAAMRMLAQREQPLLADLRRAWRKFVEISPYWRPRAAAPAAG